MRTRVGGLIAAVAVAVAPTGLSPVAASVATGTTDHPVATEAELRAAAGVVAPGDSITFTADIRLDDCPTPVAGDLDPDGATGDVDIDTGGTGTLTIHGNGYVVKQDCEGSRVLEVRAGSVEIFDLRVQGGSLRGSTVDGGETGTNGTPLFGGGLFVDGALVLTGGEIMDNRIMGTEAGPGDAGTGAGHAENGGQGGSAFGAGVYVTEEAQVTETDNYGNHAFGGSGGPGGGATSGDGGDGGDGGLAVGGGIYAAGPLRLHGTLLMANSAESGDSGAAGLSDSGADGAHGIVDIAGGGGAASETSIEATGLGVVADNRAVGGATPTTPGGSRPGRGVYGGGLATTNGPMNISDLVFVQNSAQAPAGSAGVVGGAAIAAFGDISVTDTSVLRNRAGFQTQPGAGLVRGGGIYVEGSASIDRSSFRENVADADLSQVTAGEGGSSAAGGGLHASGHVSVITSTFDSNHAVAASSVGGAINSEAGVTLVHATVAGTGDTAAIQAPTASFDSTVVAPDSAAGCGPGTTVVEKHSWFSDPSCSGRADGDPRLGPITADPTPVYTDFRMPRPDSPLIDAAAPDTASEPGTPCDRFPQDQIGASRPVGSRCDIGAVEADTSLRADLFLYNPGSGPDTLVQITEDGVVERSSHPVNAAYQPLAGTFTDFDTGAPARSDILWYAPGRSPDYLWSASETGYRSTPLSITGDYSPGLGDYDGDGHTDIFWYAPGTAPDHVWWGGSGGFTSRPLPVNGTYDLHTGPGTDVNGDGIDDLVFHGTGDAADYVVMGDPERDLVSRRVTLGAGQLLLGDYDGDHRVDAWLYRPGAAPDLLRRGTADGTFGPPLDRPVNGTYTAVGSPGTDLDGNGTDDLLLYRPGTGQDYLMFGSAAAPFEDVPVTINGTYDVVTDHAFDLDGDATTDLVFVRDGSDFIWTEITTNGGRRSTGVTLHDAEHVLTTNHP